MSTPTNKPKETRKETLDTLPPPQIHDPMCVNYPSLPMTSSTCNHPYLANATLMHGGSISGRPRSYDVVTSSRLRSQNQYRVMLVGYDETVKALGKVDVESKVVAKSGVKLNLNLAMEDRSRKTQEELWKD